MSWFARLPPAEVAEDECPGDEVADGVVIERRRLLWASASTVAAFMLMPPGRLAYGSTLRSCGDEIPDEDDEGLSFAEFVTQALPLARQVVETGKNEESYLYSVASLLARTQDPGDGVRSRMRSLRNELGQEGQRFPLAVVQFRLAEGRGFTHHDHRDYNGVILVMEGEVHVRNYDIVHKDAVPPKGETFQIRKTCDDFVGPGRFSTLGRRRDNVHDLVAGKGGARVLDVFTYFKKGATSYSMDVEQEPKDEAGRIFDAAWK